ncbi:MAG: hypothetical protein IIB87_08625, partial [Chloroflexi bacterium]|nr:hypothetical protein [Chloroflexota bacterium]
MVDANGFGTHLTIQEAVTEAVGAATTGDPTAVIFINPGIYRENITADLTGSDLKALSFVAEGVHGSASDLVFPSEIAAATEFVASVVIKRTRLLTLGGQIAGQLGRDAYALFSEATEALSQVPGDAHADLLGLAEELAVGSPTAAMEFLKSAPSVLRRVRPGDLHRWHTAGHRILEGNQPGGEAYFRMESGKGEEVLQSLSSRVELTQVGGVLRLYCKALSGTNVGIQPATALAEKGIGWVSEERPSTEGTTVYLPEYVDDHVEKAENFAVYKVYATHQTAHLEFGSFWFNWNREGNVLPRRRHEVEGERRKANDEQTPITDMERFFDLFEERQVALDLFTIVEDARIDALVRSEYSGIRRSWAQMQEAELERRPNPRSLPLRQALLENLMRASLDGAGRIVWPQRLNAVLAASLRLLSAVQQPGAIVEDTAEATLSLYELAMRVPNLAPELLDAEQWEELDEDSLELMMTSSPSGAGEGDQPPVPGGEEETYQSPQPVDFRGDFKPELVQLLMRLRMKEGEDSPSGLSPLTADQLRELMEKSVEISVDIQAEGDLASTIGLFLTNLEKEAGTPIPDKKIEPADGTPAEDEDGDGGEAEGEPPPEGKSFYYDEWDF